MLLKIKSTFAIPFFLFLFSCTTTTVQESSLDANFQEQDLSYQGKPIKISRHGRCRMECRHIDAYEVQEIINKNYVNKRKSKPKAAPGRCPSIAFEGRSRDKQHIRVILGDCDDNPLIITVIDLDNNYHCNCK